MSTSTQIAASNVDRLKAIADLTTAITPESTHDEVAMARVTYNAIKAELAAIKERLDAKLIEWCAMNDAQIIIGPIRHWPAVARTEKCRDIRKAASTLIGVLDLEAFIDCLSASAFKPGATRKALESMGAPEMYAEHFETIEQLELKTSKPKVVLASTNDDFN